MEHAIRSSSGLPADILGLTDRGYLRTTYWADVVVFDAKTIRDTATYEDPHHYADGIRHVLINGELVVSNGAPTGVLAGRALRHQVESD
jgi:N-acyl-D-amino-acid deacylase